MVEVQYWLELKEVDDMKMFQAWMLEPAASLRFPRPQGPLHTSGQCQVFLFDTNPVRIACNGKPVGKARACSKVDFVIPNAFSFILVVLKGLDDISGKLPCRYLCVTI